jgi:hypothetical protein
MTDYPVRGGLNFKGNFATDFAKYFDLLCNDLLQSWKSVNFSLCHKTAGSRLFRGIRQGSSAG